MKRAQEEAGRCYFRSVSSCVESVAEMSCLLVSLLTSMRHSVLSWLLSVFRVGVWHSPFLGKPRWIAQGCKVCSHRSWGVLGQMQQFLQPGSLKVAQCCLLLLPTKQLNNTEDLCAGAHSYRDSVPVVTTHEVVAKLLFSPIWLKLCAAQSS